MLLAIPMSKLCYHMWTLILFTKSDVKTVLVPVTLFAIASAPLADLYCLPHMVFWLWLHLLQFDTSNQTLHPEEDGLNKPYRPLPSKRITLKNAAILRWILVPICWALSAFHGMKTLYASIALSIATLLHNEMELANHWMGKNVLTALLYTCFEVGACYVAGEKQDRLDRTCVISTLCSFGVITTTMHAQDFKDTKGDRIIGRRTLPIVAPTIARLSLVLGILAWTMELSILWKLGTILALAFHGLALCVASRYMLCRSVKADQRNYYLYNAWLSIVHMLPAYSRLVPSS